MLDKLLVPPIYCTTGDLWAHLETTSGKPVADVMSTWTQQLGYPVITVEAKQVRAHYSPATVWSKEDYSLNVLFVGR